MKRPVHLGLMVRGWAGIETVRDLELTLWKREAATGPESRNDLSESKETKRDFCLFFPQRDSKVTKKRLFDPQSDSKETFGAQKVSCFGHF